MARVTSFTSTGQSLAPRGSLREMMDRRRELAERMAASQPPVTSIPQGLANLTNTFFTGLQDRQIRQDEATGREQLAQAMAGATSAGGATPEQLEVMSRLDPEVGLTFIRDRIQSRREAAAQARADQQRLEERGWSVADAEKAAQAANANREDQQTFTAGQNEMSRAATIEAARARATTDAARPQSTQAKLAADLAAGRIDQATFDAAMAKANAPGGITVNTGDTSSALRKKFDEKEGESWSALQDQGIKAAAVTNDMAILDALGSVAPQGPVPAALMKMFPGINSAGAAFQSVINRLAPQLRVAGSGSTSDIEYEGMLKSLPNLGNYPEANRLIGGMIKAKAQLDMARSDAITRWRNGTLDDAGIRNRLGELNRQSIVTPELRQMIDATGPTTKGPAAPDAPKAGDVVDGYTYLGGDPSKPASWKAVGAP